MSTIWRFLQPALICAVLAALVAGFAAGYARCTDCKTPMDRIFLGAIWSVLGILGYGFIPLDPVRPSALNLWPRIGAIWTILFGAWIAWRTWGTVAR